MAYNWGRLDRYKPTVELQPPNLSQQSQPVNASSRLQALGLDNESSMPGRNRVDFSSPSPQREMPSFQNVPRMRVQQPQQRPQPQRQPKGPQKKGQAYQQAPGNIRSIIDSAAQNNRVSRELVASIVKAESNFNPTARSGAGAQGLMQLMPGTARGLGVRNPNDPNQNVQGGTKYISQMMDNYDDIRLALAAYNWGPGNVNKAMKKHGNNFNAIKNHMPKETQNYIPKILNNL